ncbi:MAG: hypothetical protein IT285_05635 [Bdellovibrionales bacterium]|nr:hypothetical protein [Bdellovibrionales bacterium]
MGNRNASRVVSMLSGFGAACIAAGLLACDPFADGTALPFSSAPETSESMTGKDWQLPQALEMNPDSPSIGGDASSFRGFDLLADGDRILLAASLFDADDALYQPHARLYTQGSGWALPGSQFRRIADTGADTTFASLALSPGGNSLASFASSDGTGLTTVEYDGSWGTSSSVVVASPFQPAYDTDYHQDYGPALQSVFDPLGRAFILAKNYNNINAGVGFSVWQAGAPSGETLVTGSDASSFRHHDVVFDGVDQICASWDTSTNDLRVNCFDPLTEIPFDDAATTVDNTLTVRGHSLASDGEGVIRVVYYAEDPATSVWGVYSRRYKNGSWSSATRIDTNTPSGYEAGPAGCAGADMACAPTFPAIAHPVPALAHVGDGKYVAAWMLVNTTSKVSGLYYATYTPLDGWTAPRQLGDLYTYTTRPRFHSPRLSSNLFGDAVLTAPVMSTEGTNVAAHVYVTFAARYHVDVGFKSTVLLGSGCRYGDGGVGDDGAGPCSQPRSAVVLDDGDAMVVYPDQDASLRFRLMGVEFR